MVSEEVVHVEEGVVVVAHEVTLAEQEGPTSRLGRRPADPPALPRADDCRSRPHFHCRQLHGGQMGEVGHGQA